MENYYTNQVNFYGDSSPKELIAMYGSPLYIYNESILRQRCREMVNLVSYPNFTVNYSSKANNNIVLLDIIRQEGLHADAMSPGEIFALLRAGYSPSEIFYIGNNVSRDEMMFAVHRNIPVSVDSLSQLKLFGEINYGGEVSLRINPGIGVGHHEKVITAGENTKFGITLDDIPRAKEISRDYGLKIIGLNQHLGSLFMEGDIFIKGAKLLLDIAHGFQDLEFIDIGGGFGIPYNKQEGETRLELKRFGEKLSYTFETFARDYGKEICFKIEPGRYIVAECGLVLGSVHSIKKNHRTTYIGTDIGFNVLARPMLYDSHHDIEIYPIAGSSGFDNIERVTLVGNICESGDIIAKDRPLPQIKEGDIIGVMDAGAYGYSMSSNYNNRLRPAEIIIGEDGSHRLIRRRDTLEDLMRNF